MDAERLHELSAAYATLVKASADPLNSDGYADVIDVTFEGTPISGFVQQVQTDLNQAYQAAYSAAPPA